MNNANNTVITIKQGSRVSCLAQTGFAAVVVVVVQAQRQELKCSGLAPGYFNLIGDKAPPAARDSSEVARS